MTDQTTVITIFPRKQGVARRVANAAYPFRCCVVCGLQIPTCMTIAHLDHNAGHNEPDNLAFMCQTHHWMYDAGLYPIEAIRLLRAHWQTTKGEASHKARMKDAGVKAARARKLSARARKAWITRRAPAAR
jgi:predicted restriction endonuclease